MKNYITVNGKAISFATTFMLIFTLISFISTTNLSFTYASTKDSGFSSNTTTSGPLGYIPPPSLTTSTTQNDQIGNSNNNNNPSTANSIGSNIGQSQLNPGQQPPDSNCNPNTVSMINCGSFDPNKTSSSSSSSTTPTQQQPPDSNCNPNTVSMINCGSFDPNKTTTNQSPQTNTSETTNTSSIGSNSFSPNQPLATTQNPTTNLGGGSTNQLANPTAFNYQTNPATPFVDISKDPTQKINSLVTNSFGQGVPNIPISIQVKDPAGKTAALFTGKTDNNGKNVISFPIKTAGTWTALVVISSSAAVGGPFRDQITWNAISGETPSNLTSLVNLARTTVILSDDPREQILTTVKDPTGKGVKDIALAIKLTNPDAVSKTFSRITDENGVDQFLIPIDKVGNWVATLTMIDPNGKTIPITDVTWNAIP